MKSSILLGGYYVVHYVNSEKAKTLNEEILMGKVVGYEVLGYDNIK